jgi:hypothetical protein
MNEFEEEGTCELVIYCYECKEIWQLNSEMIAIALATSASIWEVYNYILKYRCKNCGKKYDN